MEQLKHFPYTRILILGLAKSGTAVAKILLQKGKKIKVNDYQKIDPLLEEELKDLGAEVVTGSHPLSVLDGIELVIKNPGIPYENVVVREAIKRRIPVITEIELASLMTESLILGITGSNGKTTTTTLISKMLQKQKIPFKMAGNIGAVATEVAVDMTAEEKFLLELSSFQLLGTETFCPHVAVILNIYEAHLDYHGTMDHYIEAKAKLLHQQTEKDYFIYNADDDVVVNLTKKTKATCIPFSQKGLKKTGAWADEEGLYYKQEKIIAKEEVVLVGDHNIENILAAIAVAKINGCTTENIAYVLKTFSGVKHRLQYVTDIQGRKFYNDSKATNLLATEKALQAFKTPIILLAGGLDRGNDFFDLLPHLSYVKSMILFGETAQKLKDLAIKAKIPYKVVAHLEEGVKEAFRQSKRGDVVLLSPACASWDQFATFEERGDMFVKAVHTLL